MTRNVFLTTTMVLILCGFTNVSIPCVASASSVASPSSLLARTQMLTAPLDEPAMLTHLTPLEATVICALVMCFLLLFIVLLVAYLDKYGYEFTLE